MVIRIYFHFPNAYNMFVFVTQDGLALFQGYLEFKLLIDFQMKGWAKNLVRIP